MPQTEKEETLEMEDVDAHLPKHAHITVPVEVHLNLAAQAARPTTSVTVRSPAARWMPIPSAGTHATY